MIDHQLKTPEGSGDLTKYESINDHSCSLGLFVQEHKMVDLRSWESRLLSSICCSQICYFIRFSYCQIELLDSLATSGSAGRFSLAYPLLPFEFC